MIRLARESREMTQAELADALGVSQGSLSKIENGVLATPTDVLSRLAKVLDYPVEFFFQQERLFGLPARFHRKLKNINGKALDRIHAEVNITMIHLSRLSKSIELEDAALIPRLHPDEADTSPEVIAAQIRELWQVPKGPIKDLVGMVEAAGGIVVLADFGPHRIDGIGLLRSSLPPVFFLNRQLPVDRLRFTLAHELGHVVMHTLPSDEMETQANRFASEFLMPRHDIIHMLVPVTLERLATLKLIWRVSMAALLKRAEQLRVISSGQYRSLWTKMGASGYRRAEPPELELSLEEPRVLTDMLDAHLKHLGYSPEELRQILMIRFADFRRLYPAVGDRIQLVKKEGPRRLKLGRSFGIGGMN